MIVRDLTLLDLPGADLPPLDPEPGTGAPARGAHALRTGLTTRAARAALHLLRSGTRRRPAPVGRPALSGRRRLVAATAAVVALTLGPAGTALACLPFVPPAPHAAPSCGQGCGAGHPACRPGYPACGQPSCGNRYGCPGTPHRVVTPHSPRNHPPTGVTPPVGIVPPADTPPGDTPPGDTPPGDTPPGDVPPVTAAPPTGTARPPAVTPPAPHAQPHPSKPAPRCGDGTPAGRRGCETVTAPPSFTG